MRTPREPKQLTLDLSRRGESPKDIRAWWLAYVASLEGPVSRCNSRRKRNYEQS